MDPKPVVSVIIIFFNAEKFLEEAIRSVLIQSYDGWELLLVDDGSSDHSTQIAYRYATSSSGNVRYLEHVGHNNRGMSASRNLGIQAAKGDYISFLDADDVWLPHKLKDQVTMLESYPQIGMVCGASQYWYSWQDDLKEDVVVPVGAPANSIVQPPNLITLLYPLGEGAAPCLSALLIRRKIVEEVRGFEEMFRGMYEDQAFLSKVYLCTPIFVSSAYWDRYRQHQNSCVAVAFKAGEYNSIRKFFLNWLEDYLRDHGEQHTPVWDRLQQILWPYRHPILNRMRCWMRANGTNSSEAEEREL